MGDRESKAAAAADGDAELSCDICDAADVVTTVEEVAAPHTPLETADASAEAASSLSSFIPAGRPRTLAGFTPAGTPAAAAAAAAAKAAASPFCPYWVP